MKMAIAVLRVVHLSRIGCRNRWPTDWSMAKCAHRVQRGLSITNGLRSLDYLGTQLQNMDAKALTNQDLVSALKKLDDSLYEEVASKFSWALRHHSTMLYIQTGINTECHHLFQNVTQSTTFHRLCRQITSNSDSLTNYEAFSVLRHLLRLHVPPEDPTVCCLLENCQQRIPTASVESLAVLSDVTNYLRRSGFYTSGLVIGRLRDLVTTNGYDISTKDDYDNIARLLFNLSYFCSKEFLSEMLTKAAAYASVGKIGHNITSSVYYLEAYRMMSMEDVSALPFLERIAEHAHEATPWHLGRTSLFLKIFKLYDRNIIKKIGTRALDMLNGYAVLNAADVLMLCTVFELYDCSEKDFAKLNSLVECSIGSFDSVLLKFFAQRKIEKNSRVMWLFRETVRFRIAELVTSISCLLAVLNCLLKNESQSSHVDRLVCNVLLEGLDNGHLGTNSEHLTIVGSYLLNHNVHIRHSLPVVTESLLGMIPQFSFANLCQLKNSVRAAKGKSSPFHRGQFYVLDSCIANTVIEYIKSMDSLEYLNNAIKSMSGQIRYDKELMAYVSEAYAKLSCQIATSNLSKTSTCIGKLKLYVPEALQSMDELLDCDVALKHETIANILETLTLFNYASSNYKKIVSVLEDLWKDLNAIKEVDVVSLFKILCSLAIMEEYPQTLLRNIFTVEFMRHFDSSCEGLKNSKHLRQKLLTLNRSVVIGCPEIDVPWFHENSSYSEGGRVSYLKNEVKNCLIQELGGEQYVKTRNVKSDYHHSFDFEYLLDKYQRPVAIFEQDKGSHPLTRVAVNILWPSSYCSNVRRLLGPTVLHLRELEILGYKVFQIPYFEIQAMQSKTDEMEKSNDFS